MSKISVAMAQAAADEAPDFTPMPADTYDAEVTGAEAKRSKGDDPQLKVDFKVVGGPCNNRRISTWMTFVVKSPGVVQMVFRQLGALGYNRDYFSNHPYHEDLDMVLATIAKSIVGRTAQLRVALEPRKDGAPGEMSNQIKNVTPPKVAQPVVPIPTAASLAAADGATAGIPGGMDVFAPPAPMPTPTAPAGGPVPPGPGEGVPTASYPPPPF